MAAPASVSHTLCSTYWMRAAPGQLVGHFSEPPAGTRNASPTPYGIPLGSVLPYDAATSGGKFAFGCSVDRPSAGSLQVVML